MANFYLDLTKEVPIPDDNDPELLAAIDRGLRASDEGRIVPIEEVKKLVQQRASKSTSRNLH